MTLFLALLIVAFILDVVALIEANGKSWTAWAVLVVVVLLYLGGH